MIRRPLIPRVHQQSAGRPRVCPGSNRDSVSGRVEANPPSTPLVSGLITTWLCFQTFLQRLDGLVYVMAQSVTRLSLHLVCQSVIIPTHLSIAWGTSSGEFNSPDFCGKPLSTTEIWMIRILIILADRTNVITRVFKLEVNTSSIILKCLNISRPSKAFCQNFICRFKFELSE